jgi:hypothetical protein
MSEEFEDEYIPEYLCIKFASGETVIGELIEETEDELVLGGVMSVSVASVAEYGAGTLVASPYCKFTDGDIFSFNKIHILFVKRLNNKIIPNYLKLVERMELAYAEDEVDESELMSDDSEMNDYLDALEKLIKPNEEFEPSTAESTGKKSFVRGNETKH